MKKVLFSLLTLFVFVALSFGQSRKVITVAADSVNGAETVVFEFNDDGVFNRAGNALLAFQALITETGGTADGKAYLEMSVDGTSWVRFDDAANSPGIFLYASDTAAIANNGNEWDVPDDGCTIGGIIKNPAWNYYRLSITGTTGDSLLVAPKYQFVEIK